MSRLQRAMDTIRQMAQDSEQLEQLRIDTAFNAWRNSFVQVPDGRQALITRFGKLEEIVGPGLKTLLDPWKLAVVICCVLSAVPARAGGPSPDELNAVKTRLTQARLVLTSPDLPVEEDAHRSLVERLDKAEAALQRYSKLSAQGETRARLEAPLALAGVALLADDATGIGAADDPLLPFIGLGLLATRLLTEAPAPATERDESWRTVLKEVQAVSDMARQVSASSRYVQPPKLLPGFPNAKREKKLKTPIPGAQGKLRRRWRDGPRILEWDYQHGTVEMYDEQGRHLGEFDPNTGQQLEKRVPGRKIER